MFSTLSKVTLVISAFCFVGGLIIMGEHAGDIGGPVWAAVWLALSAIFGSWTVILMIVEIHERAKLAAKIDGVLKK